MKFLLLIFYFLVITGCSVKPLVVHESKILVSEPKEIYVVSHGWHTGFVVPAETIKSQLPLLAKRFKKFSYLEFGWGDRGFYQAQEITSRLTLQAIFWPTESVIHVVAVPTLPDIYFGLSEVEVLCLDQKQYSSLISFIVHSFYKGENGNIVSLKNGIYGESQFYEGEGSYYLMNTCNKWTAKGLESAGFDITPIFKLTADSVMSFISRQKGQSINRPCRAFEVKDL